MNEGCPDGVYLTYIPFMPSKKVQNMPSHRVPFLILEVQILA